MFGCFNLVSKRFFWKTSDKGNAKTFIEFLHQLRARCPGKTLAIILDNSSVHKNRKVTRFLKKYPEIHLFFLPPYSPEYNPVELIWRWLKRLVYGFVPLGNGIADLLSRIRKLLWHYRENQLVNTLNLSLVSYSDIIEIHAD